MTPAVGSLTSNGQNIRPSPTTSRNHLATNDSITSPSIKHPSASNSPSPTPKRASHSFVSTTPPTRLTGYSSSEEDVEEKGAERYLDRSTAVRKKNEIEKYKRVGFVDSKDDVSDADTCNSQHRLSGIPRQIPLAANSTQIESDRISVLRSNMSSSSRLGGINSLSFGAAVSHSTKETKKRPLASSVPLNTKKRPKTGPFIIDSGSESDGESESDDGLSYDGHISASPQNDDRHKVHTIDDRSNLAMPTRAGLRQQTPRFASAPNLSTPKTASTPQAGKGLNKKRLKMLLAMKQGGAGAQNLVQQKVPLSMGTSGTDLRRRPMNAGDVGTLPQSQPAVAVGGQKVCATINAHETSTSSAMDATNRPYNSMSRSLQGTQAKQETRGEMSPLPANLSKKATSKGERFPQATLASVKRPASLPSTNVLPHAQHTPVSRIPKSSNAQTANAAQLQIAANSSSQRNIPNIANSKHHDVVNGNERLESDLRKAKTVRASKRPTKPLQRPEVGARYGHTLTARKSSSEGRGLDNASDASTSAKSLQPSVSRSQTPSKASSTTSPRTQGQSDAPGTSPAPDSLSPDQRSSDLHQSTATARQNKTSIPLNQSPRPMSGEESHLTRAIATEQSRSEDLANVRKAEQTTSSIAPRLASPLSGDNQVIETSTVAEHSIARYRASSASSASTSEIVSHNIWRETGEITLLGLLSDTERERLVVQRQIPPATILSPGCPMNLSNQPVGPEIPIAVMVRPDEQDCPRSVLTGEVRDAGSKTTLVMNTDPRNRDTSPSVEFESQVATRVSHTSKDSSMATGLRSAPASDTKNAVPNVSEPMDICVDHQNPSMSNDEGSRIASPTLTSGESKSVGQPPTPQSESVSDVPKGFFPAVANPTTVRDSKKNSRPIDRGSMEDNAQLIASATLLLPRTNTRDLSPLANLDSNTHKNQDATSDNLPGSIHATQSSTLTLPAEIVLPSPTTSRISESYFEFTIHQTLSSRMSDTATTEISAQPFTCVEIANAQTDKLFENAKHQYEYLDMACKSITSTTNDHGLKTHAATFESPEDPSKSLSLKIYTARNEVGSHALSQLSNHQYPRLLSRTAYALRLWRLIDAPSTSDTSSNTSSSSSDDNDDDEAHTNPPKPNPKYQLRIHHPLPPLSTEIHTSLDAANRAAKRVQIFLSHEIKTRLELQKQWQGRNLRDLNEKVEELRREVGGNAGDAGSSTLDEYEQGRRKGCWRSVFNGRGLGADRFELLVSRVGLSGPRNL